MQDESDVGFIKTIVVSTLPCELVVEGFQDEYSRYLECHAIGQPSGSAFLLLLSVVAWLMVLVGGLTIIFGPETISYSLRTGPTFFQLIEMYPGPIVSVGFLLLTIVSFFDSERHVDRLTPERFLSVFYELKLPDGLDDPTRVVIVHIDGGLFQISHNQF